MTDLKDAAEAAKAADADPDLGAFKDAYRHFQTLATPSAILAIYAERVEAADLLALLKRADRFMEILGGGQLDDHAYAEFNEVREAIATAIRARGER